MRAKSYAAAAVETFDYSRADRSECLEANPASGHMDPCAPGVAVVDGDEDGGRPFLEGEGPREVRSPHQHQILPLGRGLAVVRTGAVGAPFARAGERPASRMSRSTRRMEA
jgi:hypothetical protein